MGDFWSVLLKTIFPTFTSRGDTYMDQEKELSKMIWADPQQSIPESQINLPLEVHYNETDKI